MNNVILSTRYPQLADELRRLGYHVIASESLDSFISYESDHADMQFLIIDDTAFINKSCNRLAEALAAHYHIVLCEVDTRAGYPSNVALNCAVVGKYVIARRDAMHPKVREYCANHGYTILPVRQGYAKCSCAVVSDHAFITADQSVYRSLKEINIEVLLIEQGRVRLIGADYGFIGGASGLDQKNSIRILYFCGDIHRHPDYHRIKAFCDRYGTVIVKLSDDELTDIGGIIFC